MVEVDELAKAGRGASSFRLTGKKIISIFCHYMKLKYHCCNCLFDNVIVADHKKKEEKKGEIITHY